MKKMILFLLAGVLLYSCTPQEAPKTFKDNRDKKEYKTVTIGKQTWMAENLAYLPDDGSVVSDPADGDKLTPYYYVYGFGGGSIDDAIKEDNYKTYGVLYNWAAAKDACPEGWHLPSDAEWTQLETYLANNGHNYDGSTGPLSGDGVGGKIAKSLASESGWNYSDKEVTPGNDNYPEYRNKSGFSALPGGYRYIDGAFYRIGYDSYWWSSTEYGTSNAWYRGLYYNYSGINRSDGGKDYGRYVRCVRD